MILVNNISKQYSSKTINDGLTFKVEKGQIYELVGPTNSGKTTLVNQMMGFVPSDEGEVFINTLESWAYREEIMEFTGYLPSDTILFENMKTMDYIKFIAKMKSKPDFKFVDQLLDYFSLDKKKKIKKLSTLDKRAIQLITALINKPTVLILDDPAKWTDLSFRNKVTNLIIKLTQSFNITILICSSSIGEFTMIANKVGVLQSGRVVKEYDMSVTNYRDISREFSALFVEAVGT